MSQSRKNLKIASLLLMAISIAVVAAEIVLNVVMNNNYDLPFIIMLAVLSVIGLIVGYLGTKAANVPSNSMPAIIGFAIVIVLGIGITVAHYLMSGITNQDDFVGLVYSVDSIFGLVIGRQVREKALK